MKRIAFITDNLLSIGGVQRVLAVIAIALSKENDVTIITLENTTEPDYSIYGLNKSSVQIKHFHPTEANEPIHKAYSYIYKKMKLQGETASDIYALSSFPGRLRRQYINILNEGNYDTIIAVHGGLSVKLATIRKQLNAKRVIGWMHNSFNAFFLNGKCYYPGLERHFGYQLRKLDDFVVLCKADSSLYKERMGISPTVIYNPLTLTPGKPSDGTSKKFLSIGRMVPLHKGFDILIDAFAEFAKTDKEWELEIVGEGPEYESLTSQINRYGLKDRITISPFTKNIQEIYSRSAIYILSSRWEGMPLVLVEALSHGLPVISSSIPISKEILPSEISLFFETGNAKSLCECMRKKDLLIMRQNEAIEYSKRYSEDAIMEKWQHII